MLLTRIQRSLAMALLSIGVSAAASASAAAAEAILFDGDNCTGQFRMLDRSVEDFTAIGFDNRVNSLRILSGIFRFYRDAGYGEGNGPSFQLGPSGYVDTCWSLADAAQGQFPVNRMSSAQLLNDTAGPQPAGVAIVYDFAGFGGEYRILTRDVGDFAAIGFDNDVEAIRVVSGTWTFYRNSNYGAPPNRPSITLGPGDYANVAGVPGYAPGTFPGDLMSSARVTAGTAPPPPPLQCPPGQVRGNTACHVCWEYFGNQPGSSQPNAAGTACDCAPGFEWDSFGATNQDGVIFRNCEPVAPQTQCPPGQIRGNTACHACWEYFGNEPGSSLPNTAGTACDCAPGYDWDNFAATNQDGVIFRDCQPVAPPPPACPGPYLYLDEAANACAFRCHASTQPNLQTGECDCRPGTAQAGVLADGRRYCLATGGGQPPAQQVRYSVPAAELMPAAAAAGFTMTTSVDTGGAVCQVFGDTIVFRRTGPADAVQRTCLATLFGGRALAPGWRFEDYGAAAVEGQATPLGLTAQLPFQVRLTIPPFASRSVMRITTIDLLGPNGLTWQAALQ